MAEHLPKFAPGRAVTREASATITGGQLLTVTGEKTVGPTTGQGQVVAGVAARDALDTELVVVQRGGVHVLTAAEAISAGDRIQSGAAGKVALWEAADGVTATVGVDAVIGFAYEDVAQDATGEFYLYP
jgi:hypothetical protein